jgi:tetratricopeptide (TPR) repeat protein
MRTAEKMLKSDTAMENEHDEAGDSEGSLACEAVLDLVPRGPCGLSAEASNCFREGLECLDRGEAAEARNWFERVVSSNPDFADGHIGLGVSHALEHQVYPALEHLEKATELAPESFHAHFKLGQFYFLLRIPQKGYQEMKRALPLAGSLAERRLVAQLLRDERQREKNNAPRPLWNKPFSRRAMALGFGLATAIFTLAVIVLR